MKIYIEYCDFCKTEVTKNKYGFCITLGYSPGGWGWRQNLIDESYPAICKTCFKKIEEKSKELEKLLKELKKP